MAATDLNREESTRSASDEFSPEEVAQFDRDGYLVARCLASEGLSARMLEVTRDGLKREVPPVEYEAELHYPGAPRRSMLPAAILSAGSNRRFPAIFVLSSGRQLQRSSTGCGNC